MGISAQPSPSTCKAPCATARFLLQGRQLISWGFLLFRSFFWIIQASQGQQLLALLSVGFLSWHPFLLDSAGMPWEQWAGRRQQHVPNLENKLGFFFFHLRLLQNTTFAIFHLSLPLAKADSSLCTFLCITQLFLALPLSFPSLLAHVVRLSWIILSLQDGVPGSTPWDFSSESLVLAGPRRASRAGDGVPCSEHPGQGQCQVIPRSCGSPTPG